MAFLFVADLVIVRRVASSLPAPYVLQMFQNESSVAVMGIERATARAAARREEIARCQPGERLELRRERGTRGGRRVVGVYSARGVQIGYVFPEAAERVAGQIAVARAIFQCAETFGAVARITLDGSTPALPPPRPKPERRDPPRPPRDEFCDIFPARL